MPHAQTRRRDTGERRLAILILAREKAGNETDTASLRKSTHLRLLLTCLLLAVNLDRKTLTLLKVVNRVLRITRAARRDNAGRNSNAIFDNECGGSGLIVHS
jgi:hypothetical protein